MIGRTRHAIVLAMVVTMLTALPAHPIAQGPPPNAAVPAAQTPVFRSNANLILVDAVVRDRTGAVVRGLTAADFELLEDGRTQEIVSFSFDEIARTAPAMASAQLLDGVDANAGVISGSPLPPPVAAGAPVPPEMFAGRRLVVLLFDTSAMEPEDVQRAIDAAVKWTKDTMSAADLVAVATISTQLDVLADFTSDRVAVERTLAALSAADGTGATIVDAGTAATDAALAATASDTAADTSAQELDTFNNDVRLRALTALSQALRGIQQKKAILYFSSGMARSGSDNQVELRKAVNAAVRANVSIYPVDARGLQAVVPGGGAREGSRGGVAAFSGQGVADQFTQIAAQQETLQSLAADTGGTAFTDSNNFGDAFVRITKDISAYYILGFSSRNQARDGRFRRITVRLRGRSGLRVEAREGYYADRDFAHTGRTDREALLQEQLGAALPATTVPVLLASGYFRNAADRYYVPLSVAVPGEAIPRGAATTTLDIAGVVRDERGAPVARIRDTLTIPPAGLDTLAAAQVRYQTGLTLPPGRFTARIVVRENVNGDMGSFEALVTVPELKKADVKLSSVVLSTQLQASHVKSSANPLIRDGVELVPNLTHIVGRDQKLYVYYEVYEPATEAGEALVGTTLAFYRGGVKVFETPPVERSELGAADRKAALFQFEVPAGSLPAGFYTCQINVVDRVAGRFAFQRTDLFVR